MGIPFSFTGTTTLNVDRVLLPLGIEVDAIGGPTTKTMITEGASGKEKRFSYFTAPRREYTGAFSPDFIAEMLEIWTSGLGPRFGFMLHDPTDYQFDPTSELSWIVSSGFTKAQCSKTYSRFNYFDDTLVRTLVRNILIPDPATMAVFVNGTPNATFTLVDDGIIESSSTLTSGDVVTVTGEFFVPVRVTDDRMDMTMNSKDLNSIQQIRFVEVLPGDLP